MIAINILRPLPFQTPVQSSIAPSPVAAAPPAATAKSLLLALSHRIITLIQTLLHTYPYVPMYSAILNPPLFDMTFALLALLPVTREDTKPNDDPNPNTNLNSTNQPPQGPHPCVQDRQIQTLFTTSCTLLHHCASASQVPLICTVMRGVLALA